MIFQAEHLVSKDAVPAWAPPTNPFLVSGPVAAAVARTQTSAIALQIDVVGVAFQDTVDVGRPTRPLSVGTPLPSRYIAAEFVMLGMVAM
jgi:hypothetical protein